MTMVFISIRRNLAARLLFMASLNLTLTGAAFASVCTGDIESATRSYEAAMRQVAGGKPNKAVKLLENAVADLPCFSQAHLELGHIALREERFADALRSYETARDSYADSAELMLQMRMKRYSDRWSELIELRYRLQNAGELRRGTNQTYADAMNSADQLRTRIEELERMQPPSTASLKEPPGDVFFHIGNALMRMGKNEGALKAWEACRAKTPSYGPVYNNLAVAYWRRGRLDDAWSALEKAEGLKAPVNPSFKADLKRARDQKASAPPSKSPSRSTRKRRLT